MAEDLTADVAVDIDTDAVEAMGGPGDGVIQLGSVGVEYEVDGDEAGRDDYLLVGIKDADYWDVTTVPSDFVLGERVADLGNMEEWIIENRAPNAERVAVKAVIAPDTVVYEAS